MSKYDPNLMKLGMQSYIDEILNEFEIVADSAIMYRVRALCRNYQFYRVSMIT